MKSRRVFECRALGLGASGFRVQGSRLRINARGGVAPEGISEYGYPYCIKPKRKNVCGISSVYGSLLRVT